MARVAKNYFEDLFTSSRGLDDMSYILSRVDRCIMEDFNLKLSTPFTKGEVFEALKEMGPMKAPGIDGFLVIFYRSVGILWGKRLEISV